jgi:hypothetical protein
MGYLAAFYKAKFGSAISVSLYKDPEPLLRDAQDERPTIIGLAGHLV